VRVCLWMIRRSCMQVRQLPPRDVLAGVRQGAAYARGVWVRLNGGGKTGDGFLRLPEGLPIPTSTKARNFSALSLWQCMESVPRGCCETRGIWSWTRGTCSRIFENSPVSPCHLNPKP